MRIGGAACVCGLKCRSLHRSGCAETGHHDGKFVYRAYWPGLPYESESPHEERLMARPKVFALVPVQVELSGARWGV